MKKLPFKNSSTEHHVVLEVAYEGKRYEIQLGLHVFAVSATGEIDPNTKLPAFNINMTPVMSVTQVDGGVRN